MALTDSERSRFDRPSSPRAEYVVAAPDVQLVRDLLGGTRVMHRKYATYIAKFDSEPADRFKARATVATVYGGLARSLSASVGMLFAKPPEQQDDWPVAVTDHYENLDGKGTGGDVLLKRRAKDALADGFCALLIDHPQAPADVVVTAANEEALNLRPLWVSYARADVLSWVTEIVANVETLVQVVLREGTSTRAGRFGVEPVTRYRVCHLSMMRAENAPEPALTAWWELLEERKDDHGNIAVVRVAGPGIYRDVDGLAFDEIPLAACYASSADEMFVADPPLLDIAWANLEHWQIASERRWYNRLSAYPQPTIEGELAGDGSISGDGQIIKPRLMLGPTTLVTVTGGSKFSYTETSGRSAAMLEAELLAKKDEMAEMGASFLSKKTRGVETAEAKRIDAAAENATLASAAQGIEDGFNEALRLHARYLGIPAAQAPTIAINRDFEGTLMDAPVMTAYVSLVNAGYPKRLVLEALQVGGRIADDADLDQLEAEWEAGLQAVADQAAMDAQAQAQQSAPPKGTSTGKRTSVDIERDADGRAIRLIPREA